MGFHFLRVLCLCFFISFSSIAQDLYDLTHLPVIELSFVEEDWEYPLHYYHSLKKGDRHIGKVTIDGAAFDSVGVRFKGFSSYSRKNAKNPLNIKLDHIRKKAKYQKYESLKLSNGNLDPSWLREVLAYQIARKYMIAPQSNYAQVYVNGDYYGLFGNTESIDRRFAKKYLPTNKYCVIVKGNSPYGPFQGKRSSLEYLGSDSTQYFAGYELKTDHGWKDLMHLIDVLNNKPYDVHTVLNMDQAIWMLAFNNVLVNLDSYSDFQQNYYLIKDKNGRFTPIIWDLNLAFDGLGKPNGLIMQDQYDPLAHEKDERFPLINVVLQNPTYRKIYFAHCRTILEENFSNGWYISAAEQHRQLIANYVEKDQNWAFDPEAFNANFHETYTKEGPAPFPYPGITALMEARIKYLENHPEFAKKAPVIDEVNAFNSQQDAKKLIVQVTAKNLYKGVVYFRKKQSAAFQKMPLYDDGRHGDELANDGIYTALLPISKGKIQYYIFTENKEAVTFSPPRAAYDFYEYTNEKRQSKSTTKVLPF